MAASPPAKKARTAATRRECVVCCEQKGVSAFPGKITSSCQHVREVCKKCMAKTIELEVKGKGNSTRVKCPQGRCEAELSYEDVRREATKDVFTRFDSLLLRRCLQEEPTFRWCANPGCGSGQQVDGVQEANRGFNVFMRYQECSQRTCCYHRCPWHSERTCSQYEADARRCEEVGLLQALERDGIQRCPGCGHGIQKSEGCDHMTCRSCAHQFCMRCLAPYQGPSGIMAKGNSAHKRSCPWYFPDPAAEGAQN